MEEMECQYHNNCGNCCETEEERDMCLCCDCLEAERDDDANCAAMNAEIERLRTALDVAMTTLEQIATTPRNKGARRNAYATLEFLRTQLKTPNAEVSGGVSRPLDWRVMGLKTTEKDMGIVEKLRAYRPIDETSRLIVDAATEIERLQQGGEILRGELQKARHDLMVRETAKDERIADVEAAGHRLALELECLLMDTKDLPVVSRWWDSAQVALAMWQILDQQPHISPLGMD